MLVGALIRRWFAPVAGGIALIVSSVLPWWKASGNDQALDWPVNFLWEAKKSSTGTFSIGVVVILLGGLALILTFMPFSKALRRLVGAIGVAVAVLFIRAIVAAQSGTDFGSALTDEVEIGLWIAAAGGVLLQV
jgi:VIT1/CCC1 family predicted Fe2+/Mn2+ transporter